jgi:hypothetical protein
MNFQCGGCVYSNPSAPAIVTPARVSFHLPPTKSYTATLKPTYRSHAEYTQ